MKTFYSHHDTSVRDTGMLASLISCPIARIEAERKMSPMAQMVRHTNQAPAFA